MFALLHSIHSGFASWLILLSVEINGYDQKTHLSIRIYIVKKKKKKKKAEGRSEYIDLAKEANLLWHQIVSQKSKNAPRIDSRT